MPKDLRFTDGIVLDHAAEFAFLPRADFETLYRLDAVGYLDGVARFIQVVATSPAILFPKSVSKPETARLCEELRQGDKVELETPAFGAESRATRRKEALPLLYHHWAKIENLLAQNETTQVAIRGHVRREFHNCFLVDEARQWSMDHYASEAEARQVPEPLRSSLLQSLEELRTRTGIGRDDLAKWLDRTVTTQYRVFFEHCLYSLFDYIPAVTRSDLALALQPTGAEGALEIVTRCIAVKVLAKTKTRDELVLRTLDWCRSNTGERVLQGFNSLRQQYEVGTERQKNELLEEVGAVLRSEVGVVVGFVLGSIGVLTSLAAGSEPDPKARALRTPHRFGWLWKLRDPRVLHHLEQRFTELATR